MFGPTTYINRRFNLKNRIANGILLFFGNELSPINYMDNTYPFRQDSTFLYYFGINIPSVSAIIDIDNDREILFGDDPSVESIIWTGNRPKLKSLAAQAGVYEIKPSIDLPNYLEKASAHKRNIHFLPPYREINKIRLNQYLQIELKALNNLVSIDFIKAVIAQRELKTSEEIEEIHTAVNLSIEMHKNAMRYAQPGMTEAQVAAEVHRTALASGADIAFPIIATINGQILHNHYHGNIIQEGDIFLLDAGAQTEMGYAGDLSSSFPVSKRFNARQKEIYQITLNAHNNAVNLLRPGVNFFDIHKAACMKIIEGLKCIGLMQGDQEEAFTSGAHALFFPCGVGHMMGLDVHDMEDLGEEWVGYDGKLRSKQFGLRYLRLAKELKPGFVHTIEPGIYFIPELIDQWKSQKVNNSFLKYSQIEKYKDFGGIRNEENFVITQNGYKQLGNDFSKKIQAIESLR